MAAVVGGLLVDTTESGTMAGLAKLLVQSGSLRPPEPSLSEGSVLSSTMEGAHIPSVDSNLGLEHPPLQTRDPVSS